MSGPKPPKPETDLWMLYANKLRETFLQGQKFDSENRLYIPPLNSTAVMAGDQITAEVTNYGVAKAGDGLISIDNPVYTFSGDTYARKVLRYLQSVELDNKADPGLKAKRDKLYKERDKAREQYDKLYEKAKEAYEKVEESKPPFTSWAINKYSELKTAEDAVQGLDLAYGLVLTQIHGVGWQDLAEAIKRLQGATNSTYSNAYNMLVDSSLIGSAQPEEGDEKKPKVAEYAPKYTIDSGYPAVVQGWIDMASQATPPVMGFSFNNKEVNQYHWKDCGFEKVDIAGSNSFGWFFSLGYKASASSSKKHEDVHYASSSTMFECEISAVGIQAFDISPDNSWNPGNVKEAYPKLLKLASKTLLEPMVQVRKVIVGYQVNVKITLDKATYDKITKAMEKARQVDGKATASIFGFQIGVGADAHYANGQSTSYDKMNFDATNHTITFPGSNNTVPILLGVVGTVISPANK